jgi:NSS family neurotransmitter:Na+ symporter
MAASSARREALGSRAGFILAAAGSAVGLGNMWRFPYQASDGGGAAFVLAFSLREAATAVVASVSG